MDWAIVPIAVGHSRDSTLHSTVSPASGDTSPCSKRRRSSAPRSSCAANIAGGNPQFVAIGGDAVVGWCDVTPMERAVFAHRGVLGMGVVPEYRGRGVGRALVEATLSAARSKGLARIDLEVRADNAAAIGLYRAVGFKVEGVKRDALRLDDGRFDLVVMALHLDGGG